MTAPDTRPRISSVALVGAGPGDPELLTIKAVGDGVLRYARKSARVVHVGKRGGCASTPQAFIQRLTLAEALRGENVVRLKGGDPMIFGRGGEEAAALRAHGIDVVVVYGITAGLAAATSLGTGLTHRDHAHGVILVTGHARADGTPLDWPILAAAAAQGLTLVVYMGVAAVEALHSGLLAALPADTPAAVVQNASLATQRHAVCTLGTLATTVQAEGMASPAIIVIGDVLRGLGSLADQRTAHRAA